VQIPLSSPDINDSDRSAVLDVLSSPTLSLGPKLPAFEEAVARQTNSRFAVAVNSGTSGLHLCVKAANITDGDEVITSPFSFVASANCILYERGKPVFVDIDPVTYNINPARIPGAVTQRTRAILPVHVFGRPCKMDKILPIAERNSLAVIEDSCEAIGAKIGERAAGTLGQTGVFAFYPNKQMTTGEGGAIVTNDEKIATLCRSWRNQGRSTGSAWLEHEVLGYNYRLSDINCALGLSQLSRLNEILARRAQVARWYDDALRDVPGIIMPKLDEPGVTVSWFVYVITLRPEFTGLQRNHLLDQLKARGIGCNNYFTPIHLQPFYRQAFGYKRGDFPITESVAERTIALPFFTQMSESQVGYVRDSLHSLISSTILRRAANSALVAHA
jgi:perosamine synthetase